MGAASSQPMTPQDYRDLATIEARKRADYFQAAARAYDEGRRAEAKELSNKGKACSLLVTEYNKLASTTAIKNLNPPLPQSYIASFFFEPQVSLEQIDLHQLHVSEALAAAKVHLQRCRDKGVVKTSFITGRGNNSVGGVARIKPEIVRWLKGEKGVVVVEQRNEGIVVIELTEAGSCVVM